MNHRAAALWSLLFFTFVIIVVLTTMNDTSAENFIFLGCVSALILCYWTGLINSEPNTSHDNVGRESQNTQVRSILAGTTQSTLALPLSMSHIVNTSISARRLYWNNIHSFSFVPRANIARLAMRALPPVTCYRGDETTESQSECPICMEDFKTGELIQPFGVCVHEFHSSCINAWLHGGKTTCPVCRKDLSIRIS